MPSRVDSKMEAPSDDEEVDRSIPSRKNATSEYYFEKTSLKCNRVTPDLDLREKSIDMDHSDDDLFPNSNEDDNDEARTLTNGPSNGMGHKRTFDYQAFNDKRVMTPLQERFNAITMIPTFIYGIYFVLAGCWLTAEYIEMARQHNHGVQDFEKRHIRGLWTALARKMLRHTTFEADAVTNETTGCINISWLPHFHALPPLPVLAGAMGVVVHAPFSILYHWSYATKLHPSKRLEHWSRRLDHAFIHFASALMSYATSGRIDYFLLNAAYNLDCAYRQFEQRVRPRRNQVRIGLSIFMYTLPILRRGYYEDFALLLMIIALSGWFFIAYPIGGWSHSMFHLVIAFLPHLIMVSACKLQISQQQIELAAQCAVRAGK